MTREQNNQMIRKKIAEAIRDYTAKNHIGPSMRELAEAVGKSLTCVRYNLLAMREDGQIDFQDGKFRTIVLRKQ